MSAHRKRSYDAAFKLMQDAEKTAERTADNADPPAVQIQIGNHTQLKAKITNYVVSNGEYTNKPELLTTSGEHEAINVTGNTQIPVKGSFQIEFPERGNYVAEFDLSQQVFIVTSEISGFNLFFSSKTSGSTLRGVIYITEDSNTQSPEPAKTSDATSPQTTKNEIQGIDVNVGHSLEPTFENNGYWLYSTTPWNNTLWETETSGDLIALIAGGKYLTVYYGEWGVPFNPPTFSSSTPVSPPSSEIDANGQSGSITWFTREDDSNSPYYTALSFSIKGYTDRRYLEPISSFIQSMPESRPQYVFDIKDNDKCQPEPVRVQMVNFTKLSGHFRSYQLSPNGKYDRIPSSLASRKGHEAINIIGKYDSHINGSFVIKFEEELEFSVEFDTDQEKFTVTPECYEDIQCLYNGKKIKDTLYGSITFCHIINVAHDRLIYVKVGSTQTEQTYCSDGKKWCYSSTLHNDIFTIIQTDKCGVSIQHGDLYLTVDVDELGVPDQPVFTTKTPSGTPVAKPKHGEHVLLTRFWETYDDNEEYYALWFTVKINGKEKQHYFTLQDGCISTDTDVSDEDSHVFNYSRN